MKPQVTLVLICMILSGAFQASAALKCLRCVNKACLASECGANEDRCYTVPTSVFGFRLTGKGCSTKADCEVQDAAGKISCCKTDLCNSAEGVKLSLLMMLGPLIFSVLFI
ncbi:toxin 3FTx-Psa1-like [Colossoma macropomum]|uniref:toxin 3FTx-Psa1-like n=1 Tax=Colossoma macropomum TaxID=42526 RepID=UPI001863E4FE|nr:toxin 3FTx-Psa1-like [Colossoma macropomum]